METQSSSLSPTSGDSSVKEDAMPICLNQRCVASALLAVVIWALLAGCGGDAERTRWEKAGHVVDTDVIESYQGESHCDWDKVTFLRVGWPLGTESDDTSHMYVRDPHGVLADKTLAKYDADASLPEAAEDTGYSSEDGELWLVPDDKNPVAYLVSDDKHVEAWPRTQHLLGCD